MSDTNLISRKDELPDGFCICVSGDIDLARSPELRVNLLEMTKSKPKRLVVDLTGVGYMDSSGVATLVEALQVQRRHQGKLVLFGLQPKVQSIFEIARLTMVFTIVPDLETAKIR